MTYPKTNSDDSKDLAYDLREAYAKLVDLHLNLMSEARNSKNYSSYYDSIDNLHVIVKHKFKKKKEDEIEYQKLMNIALNLANTYPAVWLNKVNIPDQIALIEAALKNVEMFLWEKMDEANVMGSNRYIQGL